MYTKRIYYTKLNSKWINAKTVKLLEKLGKLCDNCMREEFIRLDSKRRKEKENIHINVKLKIFVLQRILLRKWKR